jgi:3-hydroxyacyl-[acyl-carrier-protein] dehydratase
MMAVRLAESQVTQVDVQRIMEMIPHRHPFLMIDKVVDMVANERATVLKTYRSTKIIFKAIFRRGRYAEC